jgi:hypothetical protein
MFNAIALVWGVTILAAIIVFLDWLGRRKDRHAK